jgi:hypothetical protein
MALYPKLWPTPVHDPSTTDSNICFQQRLLLASRTVLVEVNCAHAPSSSERNPQTTLKLRDDLNIKLSALNDGNFNLADSPKDRTKIRDIQTLECGAYLFELNSPAAATRFRSYCSEFNLLLTSLGRSAHAKNKGYNLVFRFVPCKSSFDPSCYRQTTLPMISSHSNSSPNGSQTFRTPSSSQ